MKLNAIFDVRVYFSGEGATTAFYQLSKMTRDLKKKHKKFICLCNVWPWP